MLEVCGDVRGLEVLDSGCGEGRFARMLAERGAARVVGVDLCGPLIDAARELAPDNTTFAVADVQNMPQLEARSFDLAVSYLNQCDLPDFEANTGEVYRVLRPGGRFVIANVHPMRSAVGRWHRGPNNEKLHVVLDEYFTESARTWDQWGCPLTNFHRTLETYVRGFLAAGFRIKGILEPMLPPECVAEYPELDDETRVPNFIIFELVRP